MLSRDLIIAQCRNKTVTLWFIQGLHEVVGYTDQQVPHERNQRIGVRGELVGGGGQKSLLTYNNPQFKLSMMVKRKLMDIAKYPVNTGGCSEASLYFSFTPTLFDNNMSHKIAHPKMTMHGQTG
jgi:hypothetical protein